jgi:CRP-like cAMP-binding protein
LSVISSGYPLSRYGLNLADAPLLEQETLFNRPSPALFSVGSRRFSVLRSNPMSETEGLDGLGIWRDLTEVERSEIKSIMRIRRIARGEVLIEQGATSETFFIVNSGIV